MSAHDLFLQALQGRAWNMVCRHMDGLALGSIIEALDRRGLFLKLAAAAEPIKVSQLAEELGARPGYLHIAVWLLASQGLVRRRGKIPQGLTEIELSPDGRKWLAWLGHYRDMPIRLLEATRIPARLRGLAPPEPMQPFDTAPIPPGDFADIVRLHLQGPTAAATMVDLSRLGVLDRLGGGPVSDWRSLAGPHISLEALRHALVFFEAMEWVRLDGASAALTTLGGLASRFATQYIHPVSYLPTFLRAGGMIFAEAGETPPLEKVGVETHIDREMDIGVSGLVFRGLFRERFLELVLPLFHRSPLEDQPACVVDTGSGDGTVLRDLYIAVAERTPRGAALDRFPLVMVGAEYNPVALRATERALSEAGIPHHCIFGDIGDPVGLARDLAAKGLDPMNALHVSKSVIHNRRYRPPSGEIAHPPFSPASLAAFAAPDGGLITAADLELNLVEHFMAWLPWTRAHGMVVMEAHTVDPLIAAERAGTHVITSTVAAHGFSHQYLVEAEVFRRAARAAGFRAVGGRDLAQSPLGRPLLSLDHFIPAT